MMHTDIKIYKQKLKKIMSNANFYKLLEYKAESITAHRLKQI